MRDVLSLVSRAATITLPAAAYRSPWSEEDQKMHFHMQGEQQQMYFHMQGDQKLHFHMQGDRLDPEDANYHQGLLFVPRLNDPGS